MSVAHRRRISTLIMGRFARNMMARASGGSVAVSRLWPGRTDRLIIAPHDLRTADATRAAEIYAGRFVFAGKIVTCHGRSIFDLEPPSEDWEVALLGFGWLRHLRAADTALTRANARSLVDDWISNQGHKRPVSRRADVAARRVISLLSQAPLVLGDTDGKFYRRYLRGLAAPIASSSRRTICVRQTLPAPPKSMPADSFSPARSSHATAARSSNSNRHPTIGRPRSSVSAGFGTCARPIPR